MYNPVSAYRVQFNKDFTFNHLDRILPYLSRMGVKTIYASPIFEAVPGSMHGYDALHPHRINPEIGSEEQLRALSQKLEALGMGWIQDIVPNHMAYDSRNELLADVLEKGPQSVYARFFDIAWNAESYAGRVMAPFLGAGLDEEIETGTLKIAYEGNRLMFKYYDNSFPLQPLSYGAVLSGGQMPQALVQLLAEIPKDENKEIYQQRWREFLLQLSSLAKNEPVAAYMADSIKNVNSNKTTLKDIAQKQSYKLCCWKDTDTKINYRRFFTINGLICLNIHDKSVFDFFHGKIKEFTDEGIFNGLRIDHIDGLYDPTRYLRRLRNLVGDDVYIVVEKILERHEALPQDWPIEGTTGYDFLATVNNLFTNIRAEKKFTAFYEKLVHHKAKPQEQLHDKKSHILYGHMAGELDNLCSLFIKSFGASDLQKEDLRRAIGLFLIKCPVYRFYGNALPLAEAEAKKVDDILSEIAEEDKSLKDTVVHIRQVLLGDKSAQDEETCEKALHFYMRCMQFTGPLMAKGFEDTLMYTYARYIGHNEVGDIPEAFGISVHKFHQDMVALQQKWPLTLNTTSTHDTKRGEDVRARLNVLTDMDEAWLHQVRDWQKMNKAIRKSTGITDNHEYFIYQTLVGFYMPEEDEVATVRRLKEYMLKAVREGKENSDWGNPNARYEEGVAGFIEDLFAEKGNFKASLKEFVTRIIDYGFINSLVQTTIKFTCPGVPDVYRGTELWDFSLVDPDNRRPVDYTTRSLFAETYESGKIDWEELWQQRRDGSIKLHLISTLVQLRAKYPEVFEKGEYIPLEVKGAYKNNVIAYARKHGQGSIVVIAPLHLASISAEQGKSLNEVDFKDTYVVLPCELNGKRQYILGGGVSQAGETVKVSEVLLALPLALIHIRHAENKRAAGVLLHITSLPSEYGVGDLGPEAYRFADTLHDAQQKYWQILPLTPISSAGAYSPYSSVSAMAGNTLLISPELMLQEGLITREELGRCEIENTRKAAYEQVEKLKERLFSAAYNRFVQRNEDDASFTKFCKNESYWLDDFALFIALSAEHDNRQWYEWPEQYRMHNQEALAQFETEHSDELKKTKWLQYIFARQWRRLKIYCERKGITLFGDMPFYVSYNSADVWANRQLFCLGDAGNMTGVAGVPPDYFSADGQLWGMPTYNWNAHASDNYAWWKMRLKKNLQLFDLVRLDHFRAFASYWQVPAGESTAINGAWIDGPGKAFFNEIKKELGGLPFVAEDLGDNMDDVYKLRDEIGLPGMKVLQFAFGTHMPASVDIPHNYQSNAVVYTGTHDNNTTSGWFKTELSKDAREQLSLYLGHKVKESNINEAMIRMAYASVANLAILPMQDILGTGEDSRMNKPGTAAGNWQWRISSREQAAKSIRGLSDWVRLYNRG